MLLRYRKTIITLLISLLVCMPFAGLQAQAFDIDKVNNSVGSVVQLNSNCDKLTKHDSKDHGSSQHTAMMDKNCASDGDKCQCHISCCVSILPNLQSTKSLYSTDGFLASKKSQSIPLLTLPTEIKPPRFIFKA